MIDIALRDWITPNDDRDLGQNDVASYSVNDRAVPRAIGLLDANQYVLDSSWAPSNRAATRMPSLLRTHGITKLNGF